MAGKQPRWIKESNRSSDFVYSDDKTDAFEGEAVRQPSSRGHSKGTRSTSTRGESQDKNVAAAAATSSDTRGEGEGEISSMGELPGVVTVGLNKQDARQVLGMLSENVRNLEVCNKSTKEALKILLKYLIMIR